MADREDFLAAIKAEPENETHRLVFADWLDEHGEHDEAERQRTYPEAHRWLDDFAALVGLEFRQVLRAGYSPVTQYRRSSAQDYLYGHDQRLELYWKYWEVVTGDTAPVEKKKYPPFGCSC